MSLALLVAAAVSAHSAAGRPSDAQQLACYERAFRQQGQRAMNNCARDAYNRAEKAMQAQWTQLLDVVKDHVQETKQLNSSQQTWLAYRAAWCRAAAWDDRGQSDWAQMHYGCLAELTRQRAKEVENLLVDDGY